MLNSILFWLLLVWMIALLAMAIWAVREVWKADGREPTETAGGAPPDTDTEQTTK